MAEQSRLGIVVDVAVETAERTIRSFTNSVTSSVGAAYNQLKGWAGGAGAAFIGAGIQAATMADDVARGVSKVTATLPLAEDAAKKVRDETRAMSIEFGRSQSEILEEMRKTGKMGQDTADDLIQVTRVELNLARVTGEAADSIRNLTDNAMDQFGIKAADIGGVLTRLWVTMKGRTNFDDLGAVLQKTGKLAVGSGLDFGTLSEAAITLLARGLDTRAVIAKLTDAVENNRPALLALAAASHVASDGQAELAAKTAEVTGSIDYQQSVVRQKLAAAWIDFGSKTAPLVTSALNVLSTGIDFLTGKVGYGAKKRAEEAAASEAAAKATQRHAAATAAFDPVLAATNAALDATIASLGKKDDADTRGKKSTEAHRKVQESLGTTLEETAKLWKKVADESMEGAERKQRAVTQASKDFATALDGQINAAVTAFTTRLQGQADAAEHARARAEDLRLGLYSLGYQAADSLGRLDQGLGDALANGLDLLASIDTMRSSLDQFGNVADVGQLFSGIGGALGAATGLLGQVFAGESASARAIRLALASNTAALEEHRRTIGDLIQLQTPGGKLAGLEGALQEAFANMGTAKGMTGSERVTNALRKSLMDRGLSVGDLEQFAKDQGFGLAKVGNNLDYGSLLKIYEGIGALEPTQFRKDFGGQRAALQAETELFNLSPAAQAAKLAALAGGALGSSAIGGALGGLDFSTEAGRGQGLAAIQGLFTALPGLDKSALGGLTGSQFLDVLKDLKQLLESAGLGAAGASATGSAVVPALSAAWLDTALPSVSVGNWGIGSPTVAAGGLSAATYAGGMGGGLSVTIEAINVSLEAGASGREIAAQLAEALDEELAKRYRLQELSQGRVSLS